MSADSVVPNPNDTYSYDRYAYVRNNPVNLTDPSGHFWGALLWAALKVAAIVAAATFVATIVSGGTTGQAFESAGIAFGSTFLFGPYIGAVVSAGIEASMHGGNVLQAMLIAGASMAIGMGVGNAVGAGVANASRAMQGFVNVLSSGIVGGAISSAMGGDFWQGFTSAAVAAGVSLAANEVSERIELSRARDDFSLGTNETQARADFANLQRGLDPRAANMLQLVEKDGQWMVTLKPGYRPYDLAHGHGAQARGLAYIIASPDHASVQWKESGPNASRPSMGDSNTHGGNITLYRSDVGKMIGGVVQNEATLLWHEMGHVLLEFRGVAFVESRFGKAGYVSNYGKLHGVPDIEANFTIPFENAARSQMGMPLRSYYVAPGDCYDIWTMQVNRGWR
jgi:hypothetical protein